MLKADPKNLEVLVAKVRKWLLRARFRKAQYVAWTVLKLKNKILYRRVALIKIQSHLRKHIAMRKYRPRILGLKALGLLDSQLDEMKETAQKLKIDREVALTQVIRLSQTINKLRSEIKSGKLDGKNVDVSVKAVQDTAQRTLDDLQKRVHAQKTKEEQERIRKLQEEMENERNRREAAIKKKNDEEEERLQRIQFEERRKVEEERARLMEQDNKKLAVCCPNILRRMSRNLLQLFV